MWDLRWGCCKWGLSFSHQKMPTLSRANVLLAVWAANITLMTWDETLQTEGPSGFLLLIERNHFKV